MNRLRKIFFAFTRKEKTTFLVAFFIFSISSIVIGVTVFKASTKPVPASGGEYTEGILGQPVFINPVIATSEVDKSLVRLLFSNLEVMTTKIEGAEDGKTWRIRLKEDMLWSDGEKITSDDVIFTIEKVQDPGAGSPIASGWRGVRAERLSELEFQVFMTEPYAFFKTNLESLYVLPRHIFKDVPSPNWKISDYNLKPIGSGPFRFVGFNKREDGFIQSYHLTVNEKYVAEKALIQDFFIRFFTDPEEMVGEFNKGQIDGVASLPFGMLQQIKRSHELVTYRLASYYAVFINQSRNLALREADVRRALDLATPKQRMVSEIFGDRAKTEGGPIPPGINFYSSVVQGEENPDLAIKILEGAGWKINLDEASVPGARVREKVISKARVKLEVNMIVPQIPFLMQTAQIIQEGWEGVGVKVNPIIVSPEEVVGNVIKNRDYEMIVFGNVLNSNSDLFPFWHSSQRFSPGLNLALYNSKKADGLMEAIRSNEGGREENFQKLQEIISTEYPAVFLYSPDYLYISNRNLKGAETSFIADPADRLKNVSGWHLKTARVLK
ncbi:MAG: Uncharacterized protein G01um101420_337 [Parcubacteria group bacterium Gr01-1014_20]|nr:MAG: Uncharacterized protein G01um101420_337 [Parcubacteria group bacterium Gr01-1014_20]